MSDGARALAIRPEFVALVEPLFRSPPHGHLVLADAGTILARLDDLEQRLAAL